MVGRLTCTRRARSAAPGPLVFRISASRLATRVFTMVSFPAIVARPESEPSAPRFQVHALRKAKRFAEQDNRTVFQPAVFTNI
jgi:hypothetical protein